MSYNTVAGPSNAVAPAFMLPGDIPWEEATFAAVDDRAHAQVCPFSPQAMNTRANSALHKHGREAVLRHRSSMGSIHDQEMWDVAAPQVCPG